MDTVEFKALIHAGMWKSTRGGGPQKIFMKIEDKESGVRIVDMEFTAEEFANVLMGNTWVAGPMVKIAPDALKFIGCQEIFKTVEIPLPETWHYISDPKEREALGRPILAPFEVEGWRGCVLDLFNHNLRSKGIAKVGFRRWLRPDGTPFVVESPEEEGE